MKKIMLLGIAALLAFTSCNDSKKDDTTQQMLTDQTALAQATREELEQAIAERDELLDIIDGINQNIAEIQSVEKIVSIQGVGERSNKQAIADNLSSLKSTLEDRRKRLNDVEAKLKQSNLSNDRLLSTIEQLKQTIDNQTTEIDRLSASLEEANKRIAELGQEVEDLSNEVTNVTQERDVAIEEATQQADIANECYYAVGTKKDLKNHGIIESGFLRKTKIMQGEFDRKFFVKADKRTLTTIPINSSKAKIVTTSQPKDSYELVNVNGRLVLNILNPASFWGVSNYVVIQID